MPPMDTADDKKKLNKSRRPENGMSENEAAGPGTLTSRNIL